MRKMQISKLQFLPRQLRIETFLTKRMITGISNGRKYRVIKRMQQKQESGNVHRNIDYKKAAFPDNIYLKELNKNSNMLP